jgi:cysteine desulfurase / selenocysteine lyase
MPKPNFVLEAITLLNESRTGSPYRSSDQTTPIDNFVETTRKSLAKFLNIKKPENLAFTFNATHGLNIIIKSVLKSGGHVVLSCFEHNAVLRPIHYMMHNGYDVNFSVVNPDANGVFSSDAITSAIRPHTKLIVWNHASNVTGQISPVDLIVRIAKDKKILTLLDCSQTVGMLSIDALKLDVDFIAGTCHKGLLSLPGLGFMYIKNPDLVDSLLQGGGGFNSKDLRHPAASPLKFEAGTPNYFAIAALYKALAYLQKNRKKRFQQLCSWNEELVMQLKAIEEVALYGAEGSSKLPITSFNVKGMAPTQLASMLYNEHNIITRAGIHCAPFMHHMLGTYPMGCVRVSIGHANTLQDISTLVSAVKKVLRSTLRS